MLSQPARIFAGFALQYTGSVGAYPCWTPTGPRSPDNAALESPSGFPFIHSFIHAVMPLCAFAVSRLAGLPLDYAVGLCIVGR